MALFILFIPISIPIRFWFDWFDIWPGHVHRYCERHNVIRALINSPYERYNPEPEPGDCLHSSI